MDCPPGTESSAKPIRTAGVRQSDARDGPANKDGHDQRHEPRQPDARCVHCAGQAPQVLLLHHARVGAIFGFSV